MSIDTIGWIVFGTLVVYAAVAAFIAGNFNEGHEGVPSNEGITAAVFWPLWVPIVIALIPFVLLYNLGAWLSKTSGK